MSQRLLSVALPVRNGADYLAAALDSILAQSFADFELFVSDNASDDSTPEILADYARRDPRVRVSRSGVLLEQAANMNRAVGLADSPWVKLFCHDDLMRGDCLAQIQAALVGLDGGPVALLGNGERHLFGNGYLTETADEGKLLVLTGHDAIARKLWDVARVVPFPAVTTATVRKAAFLEAGGFDLRYRYFDLFCWLELLTRHDYAVLTAPLTINRIHGAQVAVQARASLRELADFRAFMPGFVAQHGEALGMSRKARWRVRLIPVALAARALAVQLVRGKWGSAARLALRMPVHYWPLLPVFTARAWLLERRQVRRLAPHVPLDLLYPG